MRNGCAFLAGVLLAVVAWRQAQADGCFVWRRGADLNEPSQKAVLLWRGGRETLVLQVKYEGPAEDFAWIVPLPARPEVTAIKPKKAPFEELSLYTQRRRKWGYRGAGRPAAEGLDAVQVLERKIVGVYDVAVLAAADPKALSDWLNRNGYAFPPHRTDVLEHYTKKKWVYVAMRIDRKALGTDRVKKLRVGELQPIRFIFPAKEMVYPLRISSVNAGRTEVLLYVLGDTPMVIKGNVRRPGFSIKQNMPPSFAGSGRFSDPRYGTYRKATGRELPLTWEALQQPQNTALHLCKYRAVYKTEEMTADLAFAPFDPLPYWKEKRRQAKAAGSVWEERGALLVLAKHDPDLMERLLSSDDVEVRIALAQDRGMAADVLDRLASDTDKRVRRAAAGNPATPAAALRRLTVDKDPGVRRALAAMASSSRSGIPDDIRWRLIGDADRRVWVTTLRLSGAMSEERMKKAIREGSEHERMRAANGRKVPAALLLLLADDESEHVRFRVARHPDAPAGVLRDLAEDPDADVRCMAALNRHTPDEALAKLAKDRDPRVSKWAEFRLARDDQEAQEAGAGPRARSM